MSGAGRAGIAVMVIGALLTQIGVLFGAPGDVQQTLESPCKYPAGLAWDGKRLYLADWREAKIYVIDPRDGATLSILDAPTLKPHGLAWGLGRLFVGDDHTGNIFALDIDTGEVVNSFEAPGSRVKGLAFSGTTLFILEGRTQKIYRVLPEDGTILGYFESPTRTCSCLTRLGDYLWVADRVEDELYMVEPDSGKVINVLPAPGPHAAGLAGVGGKLWNVDFQDRKLYEVVVEDDQGYLLSDPRTARAEFLWTLSNYGPGEVRDLQVNLALPENLENQVLLSEPQFCSPPWRTGEDRWGQPCALFEAKSVPSGSKYTLSYSVKARVSALRYVIIPERTGTRADIPDDLRRTYTEDGSRYRINTPYMQELVKKIVGDEENCYWIARKIYDHLIDKLEYEMVGGWDVPEVVLQRGTGSCSEYTFCFVALCRAAGLPARYQGSVVVRGDDASVDEAFHRWAQVYLPNCGWVPVDANRGDAKAPADQARGFGGLANRFLITTHSGGDSEYLHWGYNAYSHYQSSGYCKVETETFGFWEPLNEQAQPSPASPSSGADTCGGAGQS